jgi:hypothetical protein
VHDSSSCARISANATLSIERIIIRGSREVRFGVGEEGCRDPQSGYSATARPAEDASGRVQLRGVELHVMEGERGPKQPVDGMWERR